VANDTLTAVKNSKDLILEEARMYISINIVFKISYKSSFVELFKYFNNPQNLRKLIKTSIGTIHFITSIMKV
jgi:hypothetical protein